jgi:ligand-binding sensor domain-containing protein
MKRTIIVKVLQILFIISFSTFVYAGINVELTTGEVRYFKEDLFMLNLNLTINETSGFSGDVWLACMVPDGSIYFAPKWDEVPAPIIKNLMFPQNLQIESAAILKQTIPDDNFPIKDKGLYVFAFGISDTNTANFNVLTTVKTLYLGDREWLVFNQDNGLLGNVFQIIDNGKDSGVWFGTEFMGSMFHYYNSVLNFYGKDKGIDTDNWIFGMAYDSKDNLWVASKGLLKYNPDEDKFDEYQPPDPEFDKLMFLDVAIEDDVIWLASHAGLCQYDGNDWHYFQKDVIHLDSTRVFDILFAKDGSIWGVVFSDPDNNYGGVFRYDGNSFTSYPVSEYFGESKGFECIGLDSEDCIWVGDQNAKGAFRFVDGEWVKYTEADGLPTTQIYSFYLDRFQRFWCGTRNNLQSLARFEGGKWNGVLPEIHSMGINVVWKVYQDKDNNFWFGGYPKIAIRWGSD